MPGLITTTYQEHLCSLLRRHFADVRSEWDIARGATDAFRNRGAFYAPRVDIAVGPFNIELENSPTNGRDIHFTAMTNPLVQRLLAVEPGRLEFNTLNQNPRCLLAIELSFSGSSKHRLGDFANSSIMGLIGIVVTNRANYSKVRRMANYLRLISRIGKAPESLFSNVIVFEVEEFCRFLTGGVPDPREAFL